MEDMVYIICLVIQSIIGLFTNSKNISFNCLSMQINYINVNKMNVKIRIVLQ